MEILAAWHSEAKNNGRPVVIIVERTERCSVTALAELIVLLRYDVGLLPTLIFLKTRGFLSTLIHLKKRTQDKLRCNGVL